jgi:hypothetical protein
MAADQYDINYKQQVIELLPVNKRNYKMIAFLSDCMISTLQYLRDALFGDYRNGSNVTNWSAGTYSRNAKVNYKKGIYISLINNNTDTPGLTNNWYLQQSFFIGLNERLAYNGNNLMLTYALNRWFGTTFRQPGTGLSDIYITTTGLDVTTMRIGYLSAESSQIKFTKATEAITYTTITGLQYNAVFYVPNSLLTSLGSSGMEIIKSFINNYIYAGCVFNVLGY